MDQWTNGSMDQWTNGPMDQLINWPMDQWSHGPMDQWTNRPMDQSTNGQETLVTLWKWKILEHWNIGTFEHWIIETFDIQSASICILWHQLHWYDQLMKVRGLYWTNILSHEKMKVFHCLREMFQYILKVCIFFGAQEKY